MTFSGGTPRVLQVLVAAPTYKRNDMLDGLLRSLAALDMPLEANVSFVIIDNDREGGARPIVEKWQQVFAAPLAYELEDAPGVTHVRNRALRLAEAADVLVFIDDDEFARKDWLVALVKRYRETGAAGVFGPVQPVYPEEAPGWLKEWAVHGTPITEDADQEKPGATCNCLIDMGAVRKEGLGFDPKMSLTGAEDTLFFTQLLDRGYRLVQAKDAQVYEHIPADRATEKWLMRRWYRTGLTDALIAGRNMRPAAARLRGGVHGAIRLLAGGVLAGGATFLTLGMHRRAILSRAYTASRGLGMISFALGKSYEEYGREKTAG